jgi:hypothetical protein
MNGHDLNNFTACVAGHFPQATNEDGKLLWEQVGGFDLATVKDAIKQHRLELGAKAFRPDPQRVKTLCVIATGSSAEPADRTAAYLARQRVVQAEHEAEMSRIDAALAEKTDTQLAELKAAALARLATEPGEMVNGSLVTGAQLAERLTKLDARKSTTLKRMIYQQLCVQRAVNA